MIRVTLSVRLAERKLSIRELARRTGTHPDVLSRFARQATSGVSYDLLDRICGELDCTIGEILEYEPTARQISLFDR